MTCVERVGLLQAAGQNDDQRTRFSKEVENIRRKERRRERQVDANREGGQGG